MSFRECDEPRLVDYWRAMWRAAERARREFKLVRIDEIDGDYEIVERIYREIDAADLVIADLALSSANVYLEIGYARGREKRVIQTCPAGTQLEFDVRNRRTLVYQNATTLEDKLLRELDAMPDPRLPALRQKMRMRLGRDLDRGSRLRVPAREEG
jgi:nucleoside 2-deoxyribosyltransferase